MYFNHTYCKCVYIPIYKYKLITCTYKSISLQFDQIIANTFSNLKLLELLSVSKSRNAIKTSCKIHLQPPLAE